MSDYAKHLERLVTVDALIAAAKRMRDAYIATRAKESFAKNCPTIDEFNKLLAEYEDGRQAESNAKALRLLP